MKSLLVLVGIIVLAACAPAEHPQPALPSAPDYTSDLIGIDNSILLGQVGPEENINTQPTAELLYDADYTSIQATSKINNDRAVMIFISASRVDGLFVPGTRMHFEFGEDDFGKPHLGLLGCVGQDIDVYDIYDAPADEVDLKVDSVLDEDSSDVHVVIDAVWHEEGSESEKNATLEFDLFR